MAGEVRRVADGRWREAGGVRWVAGSGKREADGGW